MTKLKEKIHFTNIYKNNKLMLRLFEVDDITATVNSISFYYRNKLILIIEDSKILTTEYKNLTLKINIKNEVI